MLDAVTYPQDEVANTLNTRFIPVQVNTQEDAGKSIVERYRQVWTPDIRVLGPDGFDYASWTGYLPPAEYLAQLLLAQAYAYLRMHDEPRAAEVFSRSGPPLSHQRRRPRGRVLPGGGALQSNP